jgi:sodium/hydrogen antiporter
MYQNAAMLAAFLLIYSAVAGWVERSWISGPIIFTVIGFILGPDGLGVLHINISGEGLRLLAELTLAMVLFTDAANADFGIVRRNLELLFPREKEADVARHSSRILEHLCLKAKAERP